MRTVRAARVRAAGSQENRQSGTTVTAGSSAASARTAVDFAVPFSPRTSTPPTPGCTALSSNASRRSSWPTTAENGNRTRRRRSTRRAALWRSRARACQTGGHGREIRRRAVTDHIAHVPRCRGAARRDRRAGRAARPAPRRTTCPVRRGTRRGRPARRRGRAARGGTRRSPAARASACRGRRPRPSPPGEPRRAHRHRRERRVAGPHHPPVVDLVAAHRVPPGRSDRVLQHLVRARTRPPGRAARARRPASRLHAVGSAITPPQHLVAAADARAPAARPWRAPTTASASPVRRSQARSATVAFDPGSTTRSASSTRDGSVTYRTATPGSQASASASVALEIRGNRTTATRSHCDPCGGDGRPSTPSVTADSESSASSHSPSAHGSTPSVGRPVSARSCVEPRREQGRVAAELVDHEPGDQRLVGRREHRDRAEQVREHPAPVDVADHDHRQVRGLGQPHVRDVGGPQVDLGRASRRPRRPRRRTATAGRPAVAVTTSSSAALRSRYDSALTVPCACPSTTTCDDRSLPGLSSTGLNATLGASPHACACIAWARPISPPSAVTTELLLMFCALNGATDTPWRASQRQRPATSALLPASEVVPATSSAPRRIGPPRLP